MTTDQYGEPGRNCPFEGGSCDGPATCPPERPCLVDKAGDLIHFLEYVPDDYDPLLEMYRYTSQECRSLGRPPVDRANLEAWLDSLLESGFNYVAFHESRIVGHSAFTADDGGTPELLTFIHPEYWDRGIGTEISRHCIEAATRYSDELFINVARSNQRATHVGKKLGFDTTPMEKFTTRRWLTFDTGPTRSDA